MERFSVVRWVWAGVVGSLVFWLFQVLTTGVTIPQFMGQQIAAEGRYPVALAPLIGWGVHVGVSMTYALLFAVLLAIVPTRTIAATLAAGLLLSLVLGWLTTLLTAAAIAVTISLLSRQGFPARVPGLNTDIDLPLYNHLLFFGVVWIITAAIPAWRRSRHDLSEGP